MSRYLLMVALTMQACQASGDAIIRNHFDQHDKKREEAKRKAEEEKESLRDKRLNGVKRRRKRTSEIERHITFNGPFSYTITQEYSKKS